MSRISMIQPSVLVLLHSRGGPSQPKSVDLTRLAILDVPQADDGMNGVSSLQQPCLARCIRWKSDGVSKRWMIAELVNCRR